MEAARREGQVVVVDFFAPWCRGCRSLFPKLAQIARKNPEMCFLKVNVETDSLRELSEALGVDRLPYFHFYRRDGELADHFTANLNPAQLQRLRHAVAALKEGLPSAA
eukprot:CAMPEP_0177590634 /NCGR_PEP_ID=MMETSP0419_2-20121207/7524_1 /TAXON_ID=582737 /ORGANISM="Tetraselmis sp., Strain GSL018" /LENGTH=107 /DNA_ID=CAMNT_0019081233 /DNA_START=476 /DNA_END=799 /DNA_ORIENTATION=+